MLKGKPVKESFPPWCGLQSQLASLSIERERHRTKTRPRAQTSPPTRLSKYQTAQPTSISTFFLNYSFPSIRNLVLGLFNFTVNFCQLSFHCSNINLFPQIIKSFLRLNFFTYETMWYSGIEIQPHSYGSPVLNNNFVTAQVRKMSTLSTQSSKVHIFTCL